MTQVGRRCSQVHPTGSLRPSTLARVRAAVPQAQKAQHSLFVG